MMDWLRAYAPAVQALAAIAGVILTLALVWITKQYARITNDILAESHKSREAAERSARAAQENLALLKRQFQAHLGSGPQRLREVVMGAKGLIRFWSKQAVPATFNPATMPDPENLAQAASELSEVKEEARNVSFECVNHLVDAIVALRNAKSEFEKIRGAKVSGSRVPSVIAAPAQYLEAAAALLDGVLALSPTDATTKDFLTHK